jgi:predicted Rossmann-fold nucleotide-binding protein
MAAVSAAFAAVEGRRGLVLGVLPGDALGRAPEGYPNAHVELAIRTHLPLSGERGEELLSRNHLNVLSADAVVALPGGAGTASEVRLALAYGRPLVCFLRDHAEIPALPAEADVRADLAGILALVRDATSG